MPDDFTLSPDERAAVEAYRKDREPKRKGTGKYTDPDTGISYEFEMTAEETAKLAAKALKGLLDDPGDGGKDDDKGKKPTPLKEYFGRKATGS